MEIQLLAILKAKTISKQKVREVENNKTTINAFSNPLNKSNIEFRIGNIPRITIITIRI